MMDSLVVLGLWVLAMGAAFYAMRAADWLWRKRPGTVGGDALAFFPSNATHWLAFGGAVAVAVVSFLAALGGTVFFAMGVSGTLLAPLLQG